MIYFKLLRSKEEFFESKIWKLKDKQPLEPPKQAQYP